MNKSDFVKVVAETGSYQSNGKLNIDEAERALTAVISSISRCLKENKSVELIGFGKFENIIQKGKEGKIPNSDKEYSTSDKYVPKFRPSKTLKNLVANIEVK